jgi:hypothetical protein
MSPRGSITSGWKLGGGGVGGGSSVALGLSLPVGVRRATVVVPKPFDAHGNTTSGPDKSTGYTPTATATVTENGVMVWDGKRLVGSHPGISAAVDVGDGVAFEVSNGVFQFVTKHL